MRFALCLVALVGCAGAPSVAPVADPLPVEIAPFCAYDVTAPEATAGELAYDRRAPRTDCVVPGGGPVFSLGFARPGWWMQFDAVRAAFAVGQPVRFEETDQASLLALDCWTWRGEFIVMQDDVRGFSVYIDTTCTTDISTRVIGQWSGPGVKDSYGRGG